ncbi:MAG: GNAT family N-acetyltransferase [Acidobacteria bacterium]|nr:GNAT family N-acetyltransferase [Acidobacteriota bacterium]
MIEHFPETERLAFRAFTLDDLPLLIEQRADPEMNRYLGGPERQNTEAITKRFRFYISCYESHGFGMCPVIWKETGEMIGAAGLQPLVGTDDIEVGYSLIPEYWRRGLGLESARAWMDLGFGVHGLERIVAVAHPENAGSRRIMEKLGMTYEKTEEHYGEDCVFYGISRETYLAAG